MHERISYVQVNGLMGMSSGRDVRIETLDVDSPDCKSTKRASDIEDIKAVIQ
jgi:hypothetical protein